VLHTQTLRALKSFPHKRRDESPNQAGKPPFFGPAERWQPQNMSNGRVCMFLEDAIYGNLTQIFWIEMLIELQENPTLHGLGGDE
jgi:hypothetical protein